MKLYVFAAALLLVNLLLTLGLLYRASYYKEDIAATTISIMLLELLFSSYIMAIHSGELPIQITEYYIYNLYQPISYMLTWTYVGSNMLLVHSAMQYSNRSKSIKILEGPNYLLRAYLSTYTGLISLLLLLVAFI